MKMRTGFTIFLLLILALVMAPLQLGNSATSLTLICTGSTQNTLTLSWGRSADTAFSRYELYISSAGVSGPYSQIWNATDISTTSTYVDGLSSSSSYWFYIADVDVFGCQKSMPYQASTTNNSTISIVTTQILTKNSSAVNLQLVDPNYYNALVPFQNYTIQMRTDGNWSTIFSTNDRSQSYFPVYLSPAYYSFRLYESFGALGQYVLYSNIVSHNVKPPVQVYVNCSVTSAYIGQQVYFTSQASGGTGSFHYQWYVNDSPIRGATSANYSCAFTEQGLNTIYAEVDDAEDNTLEPATSNWLTINAIDSSPQPTSPNNFSNPIYTVCILSVVFGSLIALILLWQKSKE